MKDVFKTKDIISLVLVFLLFCPLTLSAHIQGKKKDIVVQQRPSVEEDYGNTITLVTSGTGANEDEATKIAIRNALEQAYGTFVSSNTTVVNDELVADAIATVSSGNVIGYDLISRIDMPNGECQVSVRSVVSIGNLVTFATNHGMTTELAGNTFLMNRNLAKLNKENEIKALNNLMSQLSIIMEKGLYDFTIEVGQPRGTNPLTIDVKVNATPNKNYAIFWETIDKTLNSLSMKSKEVSNYKTFYPVYSYTYNPSWEFFKIDQHPNLSGTHYNLRNNIGKNTYGRVSSEEADILLMQHIANLELIAKYCYQVYDNQGRVVTPSFKEKTEKNQWNDSSVDGFFVGKDRNADNTKNYSIVLEGGKIPDWSNGGMTHRSFEMIYSEAALSGLKNISVRPQQVKVNEIMSGKFQTEGRKNQMGELASYLMSTKSQEKIDDADNLEGDDKIEYLKNEDYWLKFFEETMKDELSPEVMERISFLRELIKKKLDN